MGEHILLYWPRRVEVSALDGPLSQFGQSLREDMELCFHVTAGTAAVWATHVGVGLAGRLEDPGPAVVRRLGRPPTCALQVYLSHAEGSSLLALRLAQAILDATSASGGVVETVVRAVLPGVRAQELHERLVLDGALGCVHVILPAEHDEEAVLQGQDVLSENGHGRKLPGAIGAGACCFWCERVTDPEDLAEWGRCLALVHASNEPHPLRDFGWWLLRLTWNADRESDETAFDLARSALETAAEIAIRGDGILVCHAVALLDAAELAGVVLDSVRHGDIVLR